MLQKRRTPVCILLWAMALGWIALLFFFSGQDGAESGELSLMVTLYIRRICPWIPLDQDTLHFFVRKAAHFSIFAVEGALLCAAMACSFRRIRRSAWISIAACACLAVLNEFHQSFMEGRSCEVRDMIIDACGAAAGVGVVCLLIRLLRRRK